jgi:hypothetical protein
MPGTPITYVTPDKPDTTDFLLEWYKLHRAHELELNKATLAYELELAKLFIALNGVAAGAFLTLLGAIWKDGPHPAFWAVAGAITCWMLGLFAAAYTTTEAYEVQRNYTRAYRLRRHGEELRRIRGAGQVLPGHLGIEASGDYANAANDARKAAEERQTSLTDLRLWAVGLFMAGGFFALAALYTTFTPAIAPLRFGYS